MKKPFTNRTASLAGVLLAFACAALLAGCGAQAAPQADATGESAASGQTVWDACYVHGDKVGYAETTARSLRQGKRELREITSHSQMGINRFGDRNQLEIETKSLETPAGELLEFTAQTAMGGKPSILSGRIKGNELQLEVTVDGKLEKSTLPWQLETRGLHAVEQSLESEPLGPGETRKIKLLVPLANQVVVADVQLVARGLEETKLLDETRQLLRIDSTLTFAGAKGAGIKSVVWTDEAGQSLKTYVAGLEQETFRTTRERALEPPGAPKFDLGFDAIVKVERPLPAPYSTRRVLYRVELAGEEPGTMFPSSPTQQVTPVGPHVADILVLAPGREPKGKPAVKASDQPGPDDSAANNMLQSDDPLIVEMARRARGNLKDPLEIAYRLEQFVHETVQTKDFSQGFATAAEVARSKQGDCTEHAVLLAALARACELPSRVAVGLVYVTGQQGFGYHMWTEVFVGGRWLPLDGTLGKRGIGASHLKLGDSNLKGASTFTSLLSVVQVLGRLKISVLEEESEPEKGEKGEVRATKPE